MNKDGNRVRMRLELSLEATRGLDQWDVAVEMILEHIGVSSGYMTAMKYDEHKDKIKQIEVRTYTLCEIPLFSIQRHLSSNIVPSYYSYLVQFHGFFGDFAREYRRIRKTAKETEK